MSVELISVLIAVLAIGATLAGLILTSNRGLRQDMRQDMAQLESRPAPLLHTDLQLHLFGAVIVLLAIGCTATAVASEETDETLETAVKKVELFNLFTGCAKMQLVVALQVQDNGDIELTEEEIRNVAESRLRIARLYHAEISANRLAVIVDIVGRGVSVSVKFNKVLVCPRTAVAWDATTWSKGVVGTHVGNGKSLISNVSEKLDEFLVEYLRVNGESCESDSPPDVISHDPHILHPVGTVMTEEEWDALTKGKSDKKQELDHP